MTRWLFAMVTTVVCAQIGCAAPEDDSSAPRSKPLPSHVTIQTYAGSVKKTSCSGVLVAPRVALTAAHCVAGKTAAFVKAPYANGQTSWSIHASVMDWQEGMTPEEATTKHDVALVYLSKPIAIDRYAALRPNVAANAKVTLVRRGFHTQTHAKAFLGFVTKAAHAPGLPNHFVTEHHASIVDTGGPVYDQSGYVVGVLAGRGQVNGMVYAARLDALDAWLRNRIGTVPAQANVEETIGEGGGGGAASSAADDAANAAASSTTDPGGAAGAGAGAGAPLGDPKGPLGEAPPSPPEIPRSSGSSMMDPGTPHDPSTSGKDPTKPSADPEPSTPPEASTDPTPPDHAKTPDGPTVEPNPLPSPGPTEEPLPPKDPSATCTGTCAGDGDSGWGGDYESGGGGDTYDGDGAGDRGGAWDGADTGAHETDDHRD